MRWRKFHTGRSCCALKSAKVQSKRIVKYYQKGQFSLLGAFLKPSRVFPAVVFNQAPLLLLARQSASPRVLLSSFSTIPDSPGHIMSAAAARAVLRPSRLALRRAPARHASTTSEAAAKAKDTAAQATSKASEGLTKVQQSAGSAAGSAGNAASNAASALSSRASALGSVINSMSPLASTRPSEALC